MILSDDILIWIAEFFDCLACGRFVSVCKQFEQVFKNNSLWKKILLTSFPNYSLLANVNQTFAREKLKNWKTKNFSFTTIGVTHHCQPRFLHRSATTRRGDTFIFGGDSAQFLCYNDVWKVNVIEPEQKVIFEKVHVHSSNTDNNNIFSTTNNHQPRPRAASAMCSLGNYIYMFGGALRDTETLFSDELWLLTPSDDNNLQTPSQPPITLNITATSEKSSTTQNKPNRCVVDWKLTSPVTIPSPTITPTSQPTAENTEDPPAQPSAPPGRWGHTLVSYGQSLVLFGGSSPGKVFNDVWVADVEETPTTGLVLWKECSHGFHSGPLPDPRGGHSAAVIGRYMYVFGGNNIGTSFQDLWRLDLEALTTRNPAFTSPHWDLVLDPRPRFAFQPFPKSIPSSRIGHCAVPIGSSMLVYGGRDFRRRSFCTGVYLFDTERGTWKAVAVKNEEGLAPRTGHCAIPTSSGVIFFGGLVSNDSCCSDVIHLNLFGVMTATTQTETETFSRLSGQKYHDVSTVNSNSNNNGDNNNDNNISNDHDNTRAVWEGEDDFVHIETTDAMLPDYGAMMANTGADGDMALDEGGHPDSDNEGEDEMELFINRYIQRTGRNLFSTTMSIIHSLQNQLGIQHETGVEGVHFGNTANESEVQTSFTIVELL